MSRSSEGEYETRLSMQKARAMIEVESKNALRNASPVPDPVIHALSEVPLAALQCAWNVLTSIFVEETQKCEKRFCITRGPKAPPFRGIILSVFVIDKKGVEEDPLLPHGGATDIFGRVIWALTAEEEEAMVRKIQSAFGR